MKILLFSSILAITIASMSGCSQKVPNSGCDIYPDCVPTSNCSTCVPCR